MTCEKIAQKAIKHVRTVVFTAEAYAAINGPCPGGWEDEVELKLTRPELIYLIHQEVGYDTLFNRYKEKVVDIDGVLANIAHEEAWEYPIIATVNHTIPKELQDLSNTLDSLDLNNEDAVKSVYKLLNAVSDGRYSFSFEIKAGDYCFTENACECLDLTVSEALGLLYGKYDIPQLFSLFNTEQLSKDFINTKAEKKGFAKNYDSFNYGGTCYALENYLEAWRFILEQIYEEEIDEDELESWLEYFDDSDNFDTDIQEWYQ